MQPEVRDDALRQTEGVSESTDAPDAGGGPARPRRDAADPAESTDFIRTIVAADLRDGKERRSGAHAFPAGAERLPPHRARQGVQPELRRGRASSAACATSASTTPTR